MEMSGYGYSCTGGETFDIIALEVYGDEKYAAWLMCANPELCGISVFMGGETLLLPVVDGSGSGGEADNAPAKAPWKE